MISTNKTLSDRALRWVVDAVHPEASVLTVQQLQGGMSSLVHGISLSVNGDERTVVLRQFDNAEWVRDQPDLVIQEVESLRQASRSVGVQTPKIVAFDETGRQCGMPAVLMTRLEGNVVLVPLDTARWVDGMAKALARIHAVEAKDHPWTFAPYSDASSLDTSSWSKFPDKWKAAADIVMGPCPLVTMRFIHRDYHPTNILWADGEVSGVVDWSSGCVGPAGIDVGQCRVYLAQLHDVWTADAFLSSYQNYSGASFNYEPYWDLITLIDFAGPPEVFGGWTALGISGLTKELIAERLDSYLISLLKRVSLR